jgi:hypothetical protein
VRALFALQIELARNLQADRATGVAPLELEPVRGLVGQLGDQIVAGLAQVVPPARLDDATLAPLGEWLGADDVARTARALEAVWGERPR